MARKKEEKKAKFHALPNTFNEYEGNKGKWKSVFPDAGMLTVEIGCGKGDLSLGLSEKFPERNFIGMDVKSDRMGHGAETALNEKLDNIRFLRGNILHMDHYFADGEIDRIWITFPDPFPKDRHEKRRMINKVFLDVYRKVLSPDGEFRMKTDNDELAAYALEHLPENGIEILDYSDDLHHSCLLDEENNVLTDYERRFLAMNKNIHYLRFRFSR